MDIHRPRNLVDTPIVSIDTAEEVYAVCDKWRARADAMAAEYAARTAGQAPPHTPYGYMPLSEEGRAMAGGGRLMLGIDLEGRDLGNEGTVDILAIYDDDANVTYLFDVCVLQGAAFAREPSGGRWALKDLIEIGGGRGGNIVFLVYDVRMDSAALFHLYGVRLGGVPQPQPAALDSASASAAARRRPPPQYGNVYDLQIAKCCLVGGDYLIGLAKALALHLSRADYDATERGRLMFAPERGGDSGLWAVRPLPRVLIEYCAVTIRYYGMLFAEVAVVAFGKSIDSVMELTERRIRLQVDTKRPKQRNAFRDF